MHKNFQKIKIPSVFDQLIISNNLCHKIGNNGQ